MRRNLPLFLVILLIPVFLPNRVAGKQEAANVSLLERCRECKLSVRNQEDIHGQLIYIGEGYLEIDAREVPLTKQYQNQNLIKVIPFEEIRKMRCGDPTWDGLVCGFLAGAFIGAIYYGLPASAREPGYEYEKTPFEESMKGVLIGGSVGALLGYILDVDLGYSQETKSIQEWLGEELE